MGRGCMSWVTAESVYTLFLLIYQYNNRREVKHGLYVLT